MDNWKAAKEAASMVVHMWTAIAIFAIGVAIASSALLLNDMGIFLSLLIASQVLVELLFEPYGILATIATFTTIFFLNKYAVRPLSLLPKIFYYYPTVIMLWLMILLMLLQTKR